MLGHVRDEQEDQAEHLLRIALHNVYTWFMSSLIRNKWLNSRTTRRNSDTSCLEVRLEKIDAHFDIVHFLALKTRVSHITRNVQPEMVIGVMREACGGTRRTME